ncbi:AI-2E family transporter [Sanguibacter sp. HDW7]|uniref:AI-2E family transporter n=1 Tax=Sanguibacter sp. HDW7 TaxID=2714931 RepID=UPI00140809EC|nr:AI-2E family transporter [Sanguibacter sp. HDW7]QIK84164.1 AI-2E family transporter [Sanguibacter sp. HDW7]
MSDDTTGNAPTTGDPLHGEYVAARSIPPTVQAAAAWSWRLLIIAICAGAAIWVLRPLSDLFVAVAAALLFTVLLAPLHGWLVRTLRFPRALAAVTSVLFLLGAAVGLIVLAGQQIVAGIASLSTQAQEGLEQMLDWLSTGPLNVDTGRLEGMLSDISTTIEQNIGTVVSGAMSVGSTVTAVAAGFVIALFCTIFFLYDGRTIWTWIVGLLPRAARDDVHQAGRRGLVTLAAYTRTQILVAAIDATGIAIGAAALQLPLVVPLGILVFIGSFIPFVGAILTGAIAVLVALVVKGWVWAIVMLGIVLLVQQIEGHLLQPFLMGHAVSMHPVAVLLTVSGGTMVAGIAGALFAVPIAAVVNTVVLYLSGHDKFPDLGIGDRLTFRPEAEAEVRRRAMALRRGGQEDEGAGDDAGGAAAAADAADGGAAADGSGSGPRTGDDA